MTAEAVTGALLVGGASRRFGAPKALAQLDGETLAARAWRALTWCDERIAVGSAADLPFEALEDVPGPRAPLVGVITALRAARHDLCLVLPVDLPLVTHDLLQAIALRCHGLAAVPQTGPLPGAYRRAALPVLERRLAAGELDLRGAAAELGARVVEVEESLLANVNTPADLDSVRAVSLAAGAGSGAA